jgi:predicted DCC family thiol-disulfide oxidoreductase YuxK
MPDELSKPLLLIDGWCVMCTGQATRLQRLDRHHRIDIDALQSSRGIAALKQAGIDPADKQLDSVVLIDARGFHVRSAAVLGVLAHVGGVWRVLAFVLRLVPRFVRDAIYRFIAKRRLRWFGKRETCEWRPSRAK